MILSKNGGVRDCQVHCHGYFIQSTSITKQTCYPCEGHLNKCLLCMYLNNAVYNGQSLNINKIK